ncbi:MAG: ABC transporter permease [Lachnospiraceae bacterium]|nr:ABC transporter permease [Lachnospiraceae bacterium]
MKAIQRKYFNTYFSIAVMVLLIAIFTMIEPRFLNAANINSLLSDTAPLMIMAAGMTPVLLLGSIDLSIGALCSAANVLVITILLRFLETVEANPGMVVVAAIVAFLLTLIAAIVSGILLGLIHVKTKAPSFIASLAFMSIWASAALLIQNASVFLPQPLWATINWYNISFGPLGLPLLIAFIVIVVYYILLTRTSFGRGVYAIGGNERTARLAGLPVDRIKITVFAMNGFCTALGAIFLMAKARSAAPTAGEAFTLMVISAVVLGGTSLVGGAGSVLNTILGVFIVAMIQNGMNIVGVNVFWQSIVYGAIILIAIAINTDRSSRSFVVK